MNLYVVRHGQTDWNQKGVLLGNTDKPLNKNGIDQAFKLKEKLKSIKFDYVISSDLKRALMTANIVCNYADLIDNINLRERNYGKLEGTKPKNIQYFWDIKINSSKDSVETLEDFLKRIFNELDILIKKYHNNENILLVTHYGVIMAIDAYFHNKFDYCFDNFFISNCEYIKYSIKN